MSKRPAPWPIVLRNGQQYVGTSRVREDVSVGPDSNQRALARKFKTQPPSEFDDVTSDLSAVISLAPPPLPRAVRFTITGVPVPKGRPRASRTSTGIRMRTPEKTAAYERKVKATAIVAIAGGQPFRRPIRMQVSMFVPIPASWSKKRQESARTGAICATKKPDADNVLKAIKDAMNGVIYVDDAQVVDVALTKAYGADPRVEVSVFEIDRESA